MARLLELLADVQAVFCARIGYGPWKQLEQRGIQPCVEGAWQNVTEVLADWWQQRQGQPAVQPKAQGAA